MPEEVGLHRTLSWHRPRLPPSRMSISNHSTWHTHKRHTQKVLTSKLPRDSNAHITSKALHMTTISLILRASTKPIPGRTSELARCCGYEVMNVLRCLTVIAKDESAHTSGLPLTPLTPVLTPVSGQVLSRTHTYFCCVNTVPYSALTVSTLEHHPWP